MNVTNAKIDIMNMTGFSPCNHGVHFHDSDRNTFYLRLDILIRLYEGVKFDMERQGIDWEKLCNDVCNKAQ